MMKIQVDVYFHEAESSVLKDIAALVLSNNTLLTQLKSQSDQMALTLADVQADVAQEATVIDSAITLLKQIAALVAALQPTQAAIDQLASDITSKTAELAQAVVDNTPPVAP